jgi:Acetyltransferases, including N-acetylases of ribosomal proteins
MLRKFKKSDLQDLYDYSSQDGVGELAGWPHHESLETSERVLDEFMHNENQLAIVYRKSGKVIGHIGVHEDSENGRPDTKELGFVLNRDYWNRGIMTEVIHTVLKNLFSNGIQHVYACCFQSNAASRHLIEKCGFIFEREGTYYAKPLGRTFDTFEYVYTSEHWNSRTRKPRR